VVTPSYTVQTLKLKAGLEQQRILVAPLRDFSGFKIDLSVLAQEGHVMLTPEQEEESRLYRFKYKIPIHVTGESSGKASNFIMVGDTVVSIGRRIVGALLRLVLGCTVKNRVKCPSLLYPAKAILEKMRMSIKRSVD